jgi:hypothetical protein
MYRVLLGDFKGLLTGCWLTAGVMSGTATGQQATDSGNASVKADGTGTDTMTSMKTGVHMQWMQRCVECCFILAAWIPTHGLLVVTL